MPDIGRTIQGTGIDRQFVDGRLKEGAIAMRPWHIAKPCQLNQMNPITGGQSVGRFSPDLACRGIARHQDHVRSLPDNLYRNPVAIVGAGLGHCPDRRRKQGCNRYKRTHQD